jgi:hypothetical protein
MSSRITPICICLSHFSGENAGWGTAILRRLSEVKCTDEEGSPSLTADRRDLKATQQIVFTELGIKQDFNGILRVLLDKGRTSIS